VYPYNNMLGWCSDFSSSEAKKLN